MKKRCFSLLAALSLLLLTACGRTVSAPAEQPSQEPAQSAAPETAPAFEGAALSLLPAEDVKLTEGSYDACREDEPMAEIVLLPDRTVTDFRYFTVDFREDGTSLILVRGDDLYTSDTLTPDRPLLLAVPVVETIPNRGISYTDADGALCQYALVESGEDGTLFLMETDFESPS